MTLSSATAIFFLDGPIVGNSACFSSFGVMKITVAHVSKITIAARAWYCRPVVFGVSCLSNVDIVAMGSLKCTLCSLECLAVGVTWTGVVVSRI